LPIQEKTAALSIAEALETRYSARAYLASKVDTRLIRRLLQLAATAPSGVNTQPWKAYVATGETLSRLTSLLAETFFSGKPEQCGYQYYPVVWRSPYLDRRQQGARNEGTVANALNETD